MQANKLSSDTGGLIKASSKNYFACCSELGVFILLRAMQNC